MNGQELDKHIQLYRSTVYRLAYSYMKNREDAEDISQDAFVKLYISDEDFASEENVKAWLIRVTINLCKNMLRSSQRKTRSELTAEPHSPPPEHDSMSEYIAGLKPQYSAVLYLFYYEGYSVKEISRMCGISSVAVRTRLSRGRSMLKEMLLKEELL